MKQLMLYQITKRPVKRVSFVVVLTIRTRTTFYQLTTTAIFVLIIKCWHLACNVPTINIAPFRRKIRPIFSFDRKSWRRGCYFFVSTFEYLIEVFHQRTLVYYCEVLLKLDHEMAYQTDKRLNPKFIPEGLSNLNYRRFRGL